MRRAPLLALASVLLAACGLAVTGAPVDEAPGSEQATARPDGSGVDGDVNRDLDGSSGSVDAEALESSTFVDAGPRPDARTAPPLTCLSNSCATANPCGVEKCTTGGHWTTLVGGSAMLNVGGQNLDCVSTTGGYMAQSLTTTAPTYRYALGVAVRDTGSGSYTIGEIAVGSTTVVSLQADNGIVKICRPATASLPAACAGALTLATGGNATVVAVYGRLSQVDAFGSATLARGTGCQELGTIDLDSPKSGAVDARFGCLNGAGCNFRWYDARIELTPLQ